jgi:hypothetical protein
MHILRLFIFRFYQPPGQSDNDLSWQWYRNLIQLFRAESLLHVVSLPVGIHEVF